MLTFYKVMGLLLIVASAFFVVPTLVSQPDNFAVGLGVFFALFAYPGAVAVYVRFFFLRKKKPKAKPKAKQLEIIR